MFKSWQENNHLLYTRVIVTLAWAISLTVSVSTKLTDPRVQPNGPEQTGTCGNVCEYDEWFNRAHCDDRGLTYVPSCTGCEGVTLLELQENNIETIQPERIAEYNNVKTLDISWNQICAIVPGTFWSLKRLRNIIFSHNMLQVVPDGLFNGTGESVVRIYLDDNNIHTLGDRTFEGLIQVTDIYLTDNNIQVLPLRLFSDVINIKHLTLANNKLKYLHQDHFNGLEKLITLSLQGNNIEIIPEGLFADLESLKEVVLSDNHLITIPAPKTLGVHYSVEGLDFTNNQLNETASIFPFLVNATWTVYLEGNPFLCDCDFQKLQEWFNTTSTPQTIHSSSETPLTCEFNDGIKYRITDHLPNLCSDTTSKSRQIDIWSSSSVPATVQPVTENQRRQLVSREAAPGWLSIVTFIEVTLIFMLLLMSTILYILCKNGFFSKMDFFCKNGFFPKSDYQTYPNRIT